MGNASVNINLLRDMKYQIENEFDELSLDSFMRKAYVHEVRRLLYPDRKELLRMDKMNQWRLI